MRSRVFVTVLALVATLLTACGGAAPQGSSNSNQPTQPAAGGGNSTGSKPTVEVNAAILGAMQDAPILLAQEKGYFAQEGLKVNLIRVKSGADMVAQLAAGQLDTGLGAVSAGMINAALKEISIKIVADGQTLQPGWSPSAIVVRKALIDSGKVKDFKDLKGLVVAHTGNGSTPQTNMAKALEKGGLTFKDVDVKMMGFPEQLTAMANGSIDAASASEPYVTQGVEKGIWVRWKGVGEDVYPGHSASNLLYAPTFMKNKADAAKGFMVAYLKGVRDWEAAFGPQKTDRQNVITLVNKSLQQPDLSVYDKVSPPWFNPNGHIYVESLQADADWYAANGYANVKFDMQKMIDNQYVDAAVQKLGKVEEKY